MSLHKELSLQYRLRPSSIENPPLLLLVHGYGSNEDDLFSFAPYMTDELLIVSVRAPYDMPPQGAAWYAIDYTAAGGKFSDLNQARESMQLIEKFLNELKAHHNYNQDSVNILGFSQGAILSLAMSLNNPALFKNVVAMSGYLNVDLVQAMDDVELRFRESKIKPNYFISHGSMDQVIPADWARRTAPILKKLEVDQVYKEYAAGHGVAPDNFADMKSWLEARL
ncbi:alpha/beta hydrolase [Nonlabens ponticola]|uniref:Phospholipase n=1 Tax=Nonlabens ponticola TaxID=2496866 RepID=A0A3S9MZI8_9FLAO|nr:alpha/beta fold hydrolase [Nonlabens ponticola]AZQ44502.1 phospholipase [Nonlabens ponticola]